MIGKIIGIGQSESEVGVDAEKILVVDIDGGDSDVVGGGRGHWGDIEG